MSSKELLEQILKNQKRILEIFEYQRKIMEKIEERLNKIENIQTKTSSELTPSLIRVLNGLIKSKEPLSAGELAEKIDLSRNLVSGYLNSLVKMGYVLKEPNLNKSGPRYLFKANIPTLPDNIRKIIEKYERDKNV